MKWIRLWCEDVWCGSTFTELTTYQFGVWMKLLIAAGLRDNNGVVPSYLLQTLSQGGNQKAFQTAIQTLLRNNKITQNEDGSLTIVNWAKYQTRYEKYYKNKPKENSEKLAYTCHTDTEGEVEGEVEDIARSGKPKRAVALCDDEFIQILKENPAYKGIDIDRELGKLDAWLLTPRGKGKQKTRQRVVNWLNGAEKPMAMINTPPSAREVNGKPSWIEQAKEEGWKV